MCCVINFATSAAVLKFLILFDDAYFLKNKIKKILVLFWKWLNSYIISDLVETKHERWFRAHFAKSCIFGHDGNRSRGRWLR